ncbi:hypothetical protein GCM10022221_68540 [Actinocorallia aurea]
MKRSSRLNRSAGLARGGLSRSRAGLSRAPRLPAPKRTEPARARRSTGPSPDTRALVLARDGHACVVCGLDITRRPHNIHHRLPRGMGGSSDPAINSPANLITVCGSGTTGCHGEIERNREWAQDHGWIVPRGMSPAASPIVLFGCPGRFLLLSDGGIELA